MVSSHGFCSFIIFMGHFYAFYNFSDFIFFVRRELKFQHLDTGQLGIHGEHCCANLNETCSRPSASLELHT